MLTHWSLHSFAVVARCTGVGHSLIWEGYAPYPQSPASGKIFILASKHCGMDESRCHTMVFVLVSYFPQLPPNQLFQVWFRVVGR